jgi:hypothetical protein
MKSYMIEVGMTILFLELVFLPKCNIITGNNKILEISLLTKFESNIFHKK